MTTRPTGQGTGFDLAALRARFPALQQEIHGKPLAYLDNAATAQKPQAVLDALAHYYAHDNANVHRGVHTLSQRATAAYEGARKTVATAIGAASSDEVIFVRGATEGINLVAQAWLRPQLQAGDEVLVSAMEHHSNIVPWQLVCAERGARLRVIPINDAGELELDKLPELIGPRTKLIALVHVSNALGTINPVEDVVATAREHGVPVLLDGAQAVPHGPVDVGALGCDFYVLSGHKVFGPTGIGVLWGRRALLENAPPWQGGGDMIRSVRFEGSEFAGLPYRFEAGTPHIAGAVGLGAAFEFMAELDWVAIKAHERALVEACEHALDTIPGIRRIGTAARKAGVVSFVIDGVHPHDIGTIVDGEGVAIRAGHHCAQPVMEHFGVPATARASFAFYNSFDEVDQLLRAIHRTREIFA